MEQVGVPATYQVFINHRGPDTKKKLASLIYHRLISCGLRVFLDKDELVTGDTVCPAIRKAIRSSSVHICIFSERYAESRPCLAELCWILNSSHEPAIIPVFCDVEPHDLRNIGQGPYALAFQEHQRKGKVAVAVMKEWKEALRKTADISGLVFKTNESEHGVFLEQIVKIVLREVKWDPLDVATNPVGLEQALEDFQNEIDANQSATKVVAIVGIGGIGKSTLAKHLFNLRRSEFQRSSYLSNVREKNDLASLQRQLFRDLLGVDMHIVDTDSGRSIARNSLGGLRVLIVLDDVDEGRKIKSLLHLDGVGHGSLILITSRDKDILNGSTAKPLLYEVKPMKRKFARELFCLHAFHQSKAFEGYDDLVEELLEICGGLPLCLKVLGEQFAGKLDKAYWKRQLEKYSQGFPLPEAEDVLNILKWSYNAMKMEEKMMFLDIGCFLVGEDSELAVRVLEGLGFFNDVRDCLTSLCQKCLVDVDNDEIHSSIDGNITGFNYRNMYDSTLFRLRFHCATEFHGRTKIIMENQVRDLVRHIVREESPPMEKPMRLNCSTDIAKMLLQDGSESCRVRGIRIPKGEDPSEFNKRVIIKGLRLLVVEHPVDLSKIFCSAISGELVWLRLHNCRFISIPRTISLGNLRVLELKGPLGDMERFFNEIDEIPWELGELSIDNAFITSTSASSSSVQPVDVQHSERLSHRKISTSSKKNISRAQQQNISRTQQRVRPVFISGAQEGVMPSVTSSSNQQGNMPSIFRFLGWMGTFLTNLTKIQLTNLKFLRTLPIDFSELKILRHLDLSGCIHLTRLPNSFPQLLQLQYLALRNCKSLSIPEDIMGEMSTLEYVDFQGCAHLIQLPLGMAHQTSLRYLNLVDTPLLQLPENLELLDKLEQLSIGSANLTELPRSVGSLVNLKQLILIKCLNLMCIRAPIENLSYLERLELYQSKVPILPGRIASLKHLKVLSIYSCPIAKFDFAANNSSMDTLRDFTLNDTSLSKIDIPKSACPGLEIVDLACNKNLMHVQGFPSTLVRLNLECCSKLKTLTNISNLVHLKFLNVNGCIELETLNVEGLRSLEELRAEECWKLQNIKALGQLERVNCLQISTQIGTISNSSIFEKALRSEETARTVGEVDATNTITSPFVLQEVHRHFPVLMCFITTNRGRSDSFSVSFRENTRRGQSEVYETVRGNGSGGRMLHIYMWKEDSKLFIDDNCYDEVVVYHNNHGYDGSWNGKKLDAGEVDKGWVMTSSSETQVSQVCNQIIRVCLG